MIAAILLACLSAVPAHASWTLEPFMISAWGEPTDDASAAVFADSGLNTVMAKAENLDLCRKHGLRAIVMDGTPELATKHRDDPAVWGWYVRDEPKAEEFVVVADPVAKFQAADPNHPAYVNLMSWMDLDQYFATVKPLFLSYDFYQWWWGSANYCGRLQAHRAAALKAKVPLICWIEANSDPRWEWGKPGATTLPDNPPKLRQSVTLALAYGVRGIQWFTAGLMIGKDAAGHPALNESGQQIRAINRDIAAMGPTLLGLQSTAVYHTKPLPEHTEGVPGNLWVQASGGQLTLGLFEDAHQQRHLMLVNRDIARTRAATLTFACALAGVERLDCATKQWAPVPLYKDAKGQTALHMKLAPGDGALLRVK